MDDGGYHVDKATLTLAAASTSSFPPVQNHHLSRIIIYCRFQGPLAACVDCDEALQLCPEAAIRVHKERSPCLIPQEFLMAWSTLAVMLLGIQAG